jgi:hypothetical protein
MHADILNDCLRYKLANPQIMHEPIKIRYANCYESFDEGFENVPYMIAISYIIRYDDGGAMTKYIKYSVYDFKGKDEYVFTFHKAVGGFFENENVHKYTFGFIRGWVIMNTNYRVCDKICYKKTMFQVIYYLADPEFEDCTYIVIDPRINAGFTKYYGDRYSTWCDKVNKWITRKM